MTLRFFATAVVLFIAVTSAAATTAQADGDLPDAKTLRKRIDAAAGSPLPRERLATTYTVGGIGGDSLEYRDGENDRTVTTTGPFREQEGTYDGQDWIQNRNHETVLRQPDPGKATADTFVGSVNRVTTPVNAYVLSELNTRGSGTRIYVDPVTYRVVRRERITPNGTTVTVYDDFRTVEGSTRAWHWHSEDGFAANTTDERITALDSNVTPADLKIPGGPIFVAFPQGQTSVALPVKMTSDEKFLVRVDIGGRGLDFILDTGADGITIDDDVVKQLGLKSYETHSNPLNAQRYSESATIVPEMSVGPLQMRDVAISTIPDIGEELPHEYKAVGLLGFDFIADVALKLDYAKGTVTAISPEAFVAPDAAQSFAIPVRLGSGTPATDVTINGALGERFTIDTGAAGGMMIFDYFARRHPEALKDEGGRAASRIYFSGVGGEIKTDPVQLQSVRIGPVDFTDFIAYKVTSKSYSMSEDGVVGPAFLHFFTVYTDYANSQLYLTPIDRSSLKKK